jgi:nucleotide-binding universal stress UspA family protein
MHRHILIPTDGSDLSAQSIEYGVALAKAVGAKVTGLTVTQAPNDDAFAERTPLSGSGAATVAARYLQVIADAAKQAGIACEVVHVQHEHPYQAIINTANEKGCDLVVMASHGRRRISAALLGSETIRVLSHSSVPVLVYRGEGSRLFPPSLAGS